MRQLKRVRTINVRQNKTILIQCHEFPMCVGGIVQSFVNILFTVEYI